MPDRLNVPNRSLFTGDNLDILRDLNSTSVDLIYADPPRNSGQTLRASPRAYAAGFFYEDKWTANDARPDWEDEIAVRQPDAMHIINSFKLVHDEGMINYLVFLTVRLLELQRVLKPSGSIYVQCRTDSAHCIKAIMDTIFGSEQFKNDIAFGRIVPSGGNKMWKWAHDKLLFYAGPHIYTWNQVLQPHPADYYDQYVYEDERGKYQSLPLAHEGVRSDDRGAEWRGYNPSKTGRHWSVPMTLLRQLCPERSDLSGLTAHEKLDLLDANGMIHWRGSISAPRYKMHADTTEGGRRSDIVATIKKVDQKSQEGTGWPEQVPEELLEVIIKASTDEGDIVLDPFSGSGTACVVAEKLKRHWVGIEQALQGFDVLESRLRREVNLKELSHPGFTLSRADWKESSNLMTGTHAMRALYEKQSGKCNGCQHELPIHVLTTDLVDRSPAAPAGIDNLQLLCHYCRTLRGDNDMNYLVAQVYEHRVHKALDSQSYQ